jgi:hypothetical protein
LTDDGIRHAVVRHRAVQIQSGATVEVYDIHMHGGMLVALYL